MSNLFLESLSKPLPETDTVGELIEGKTSHHKISSGFVELPKTRSPFWSS
ncbi:hypothetical protein [Nostoc sp. UHCC 0251]|nr:hypothetical protein [Nostoc sp. UHCC 0251]MEA5621635.1 hypothetical protein [Nostoc sp. UHCC 0251]